MNVADKARSLAVNMEAKKDSLAQRQSGEWKLAFTVQAGDVPTELLTAPMGTRYMIALVEIGDDEAPVEKPKDNPHRLSQQAAILCDDARFRRFLTQVKRPVDIERGHSPAPAADMLRATLDIASRSDLDTNPEAAARWRNLKAEYEGWLRT
jgi:hypothetical protein